MTTTTTTTIIISIITIGLQLYYLHQLIHTYRPAHLINLLLLYQVITSRLSALPQQYQHQLQHRRHLLENNRLWNL
jgi:uncharacterized membrane protein